MREQQIDLFTGKPIASKKKVAVLSKFIIKNNTELADAKALSLVSDVISDGRVSDDGDSYCYETLFGTKGSDRTYLVSAKRNKSSDTFIVSNGPTR